VKMPVHGEEKRSTAVIEELMGKGAGMARIPGIVRLVYQALAEVDHAVCQQYPSLPRQHELMLVSSRLADPQ